MRSWWACVTLIRVPNCLMAAAAVAVGWYLLPGEAGEPLNRFAMAATFFVCGLGNIINDIRDLEVDRIIHPRRALPSGMVSLARARTLAFLFLAAILILMIGMNGLERTIVVAALILIVFYNLKLKQTAYWGNLAISILAGATFVLGGAPAGFHAALSLPGPVIPALFAVLMHFGREIIKDVQDSAGDKAHGMRTAPIQSGIRRPLLIADTALLILCLFAIGVYFPGWFNRVYLVAALVLICIPTVVEIIWLGGNPSHHKCLIVSALVKWQMVIGLIALIIGKSY